MCLATKIKTPEPRRISLPEPPSELRPEKDMEKQLEPEIGADREKSRNRRGVRGMRTDLSLPTVGGGSSGLTL